MNDVTPEQVCEFISSGLDQLRGDWTFEITRDRDGLPVSLEFEGPQARWGAPISLRLTQRAVGIGKESISLRSQNAGPRLLAVLAIEVASFVASYRPPLIRPAVRRA